jgi:hypothetical protein
VTDLAFLIVISALVVIVIAVIRIVPDRSRYAVFQAGNFIELKGPGLLVKLPGRSQKWVRLSVGDKADLIDLHLAAINGVNIPIESEEGEASGIGMRVSGFRDDKVLVGTENA